MKQKSIVYLLLLGMTIAAFFMFTGGITDNKDDTTTPPSLSNFTLKAAAPVIYAKLPFEIQAFNNRTTYNSSACKDEYYTTRDLVGSLVIKDQGSNTIVDSSEFIFVSEDGGEFRGYTGVFADTVSLNYTGNYTATARFYNSLDTLKSSSISTLNFSVGAGSAIQLSPGTYQLSSFSATCTSGGTYTYTNSSASNKLVINADRISAALNIQMTMGASALAQYPCLKEATYNYNASGNYTIGSNNGSQYFRIEYENSAFVNFNFSFDGINLSLNYTDNGSSYSMSFVKQ